MDLQEQLEIGKQAEDFLRYTEENGYFNRLIERIRLEYASMILELRPSSTEEFTNYRHRMDAIAGIMNSVKGDIYAGQVAYEKINGLSEEPKGLL